LKNPKLEIGMTAMETVVELVKGLGLKKQKVYFGIYPPHPKPGQKFISLEYLMFHQPFDELILLNGEDVTSKRLESISSSLKSGRVLAIQSILFGDETESFGTPIFHFPLMDFSCPESPENLKKIKNFLGRIGQKRGVILFSGKSYHYYGLDLFYNYDRWMNFLGDCGLSELVNGRYIMHSLKDSCSALRLSACPLKPEIPTVVSVL